MKRFTKSALALILCLCTIFSGTVIAFAADVATPTGLTVTMNGSNIIVKWNAVSGADAYSVERATDPNGKWKEVKDKTTSTEYTDKDITGGATYYYRVRAFKKATILNWNRTYSDYSASATVIVDPSQVTGLLAVTAGATSIKLAWDLSEGADGYQVYMFDSAINDFKKIATTSKNTYTVRKLEDRTSYRFKVRSYHKLNGVTYSSFSNELTVATVLDDVANFKLTSSTTNSYTISWEANPEITGFQLSKYDKENHVWNTLKFGNSFITTDTSYAVTNLKEGDYDKYKIRSVIENGDKSVYGNWSDVLYGGALPKAPTGLDAAANTDNGLSLTWDPLEGAAGYEVFCKKENGNFISVGTTTRNHFNHKNLEEKKYYEYKVRAFVGNEANKWYGNSSEVIKKYYEPIEVPEGEYPDDWQQTGVFGYLYDSKEQCYYSSDDPWQRNFGYAELYDNAAPLVVMYIETVRIKFEYDNRDWMFQFWKGQYGWVLYGSEIGIYTKDKNVPVQFYECANDEDMIQMEMVLYEKSDLSPTGWVKTFGRPYQRHWWHTGFVWGNKIGKNEELKMCARLTMRDFEMRDAVIPELLSKGFKQITGSWKDFTGLLSGESKSNDCFYTNGLDIYISWTEIFE